MNNYPISRRGKGHVRCGSIHKKIRSIMGCIRVVEKAIRLYFPSDRRIKYEATNQEEYRRVYAAERSDESAVRGCG